jgi:MEDS: MEthanogen/methylotroph, DcmR Sensory domain
VGANLTLPTTFHHEALFYAGDGEFAERCRDFVEEGLERDEPVLVMVGSRKLELLRRALGTGADEVHFADMEVVGRNPARIIPEWAGFVADQAREDGVTGMRGIASRSGPTASRTSWRSASCTSR